MTTIPSSGDSAAHTDERSVAAFKVWLWAVRPRTLPLAASAIVLGFGLAGLQRGAAGQPLLLAPFGLALLTAVLLQVLSNLANDYGDAVSGADNERRVGPLRVVNSGLTSRESMRRAIALAAGLSFLSGLALVFTGTWGRWGMTALFLAAGVACVAAAVAYTMGKRPYGYIGLGDLMVCIFFGFMAVCGSAILCGAQPDPRHLLPGLAAGLFATAVLNINNMRDRENDQLAGKKTMAVRLGLHRARIYHLLLVGGGLLAWMCFWAELGPAGPAHPSLFILATLGLFCPLARSTWLAVTRTTDAACMNRQLKNTVLSTALINTGCAGLCFLA